MTEPVRVGDRIPVTCFGPHGAVDEADGEVEAIHGATVYVLFSNPYSSDPGTRLRAAFDYDEVVHAR